MTMTRRDFARTLGRGIAAAGGALAAGKTLKGCKTSSSRRQELPTKGTLDWKRLYPGEPIQVGGTRGVFWVQVGWTPEGEPVFVLRPRGGN